MSNTILYIVPDLFGQPGGIARYCRMVCRALLQAGYMLHVIALCDEEKVIPNDSKIFKEISYTPCNHSRTTFVSKTLYYGVTHSPQMVMVGHVNLGPVGWCVSQIVNVPMVTAMHGIDVWTELPLLRKWALKRSDMVLSVSHYTVKCAIEANQISRQRTKVLPNCLDPSFSYQLPRTQCAQKLNLLTVGRLSLSEQYKGHDYVIRALPALLKRFPNLVYDIVGDGDGRSALETLATELHVRDAVRFHSFVTEEQLKQFYADSSVFIMPSRGEGFGIVFLEAMAHGLPVIGGNLDATPEVIVNGQTGYTINPTSINEIVIAVTSLLDNEDLRKQMGQAGIHHVYSKFSYDSFQQTLLSHLADLNSQ